MMRTPQSQSFIKRNISNDDDDDDEEIASLVPDNIYKSPVPRSFSHHASVSSHHPPHTMMTMMMRRTPGPTQNLRMNPAITDSTPTSNEIYKHSSHATSQLPSEMANPNHHRIPKTIRKSSNRNGSHNTTRTTTTAGATSSTTTNSTSIHSNVMKYGFSPLAPSSSKQTHNHHHPISNIHTTTATTSSSSSSSSSSPSMNKREETLVPATPNVRPPMGNPTTDRKLYTPAGNMLIKNTNLGLRSSLTGTLTPSTALMVSNIDDILNDPDDDDDADDNVDIEKGVDSPQKQKMNDTITSSESHTSDHIVVVSEIQENKSFADSIASAVSTDDWGEAPSGHETNEVTDARTIIADMSDVELFRPKKMITAQKSTFQNFNRVGSDLSNVTNKSNLSAGSKNSDGDNHNEGVRAFVPSGSSFHAPKATKVISPTRSSQVHHHHHHHHQQQHQHQHIREHEVLGLQHTMHPPHATISVPQYHNRHSNAPVCYNDPSMMQHHSIPPAQPQMGYHFHSHPYSHQMMLPHHHSDPSSMYDMGVAPYLPGHMSPMFGGASPINLPMMAPPMQYATSPIPFEQPHLQTSWGTDTYVGPQRDDNQWMNSMDVSTGWEYDHFYSQRQYDLQRQRSRTQSPHTLPPQQSFSSQYVTSSSNRGNRLNGNQSQGHKSNGIRKSFDVNEELHKKFTTLNEVKTKENARKDSNSQYIEPKRQLQTKENSKIEKESDLDHSCLEDSDRADVYRSIAGLANHGHVDIYRELSCDNDDSLVEAKKAELNETPTIRSIFKEFYRKFRLKEKESLDTAADFARSYLEDKEFPRSVHWRIYLELADLAKRKNNFVEARNLYKKLCQIQPYASQGWLERSKLEEECGNLQECSKILKLGLTYCPQNENMRIRAIKHEERMAYEFRNGDLTEARKLITPLQHFSFDKVWKTELEAALMEARAGNEMIARKCMKYLMRWISWYGPLYLEAFRLERDFDHPIEALAVVERGLHEIPRYGPLWFGAFRICEGLDITNNDFHLPKTLNMIERAIVSISRELIWKVQMEAAQAIERAAHLAVSVDSSIDLNSRLEDTRSRFARTIISCPDNLCWKVWLAAGRMELSGGRYEQARKLCLKSLSVVPSKGKPSVLLECVKLEEFVGNIDLARAIMEKTKFDFNSDWKVWLQNVMLEARNGNRALAIKLAQEGLLEHSGTGRLWATLIHLYEPDGEKLQFQALKKALRSVPKSGEVWCEAARIHLNPLSPSFDLPTSNLHLQFATKFTPQYGDSFLETLRHDMIVAVLETCMPKSMTAFVRQYESFDFDSKEELIQKMVDAIQMIILDFESNQKQNKKVINNTLSKLDTGQLELRCSIADPNYGKLWFHKRLRQSDTARSVLKRSKQVIWSDLERYAYIYVAAVLRQEAISVLMHHFGGDGESVNMPSVEQILKGNEHLNINTHQNMKLLEGISKANFVSGFVEVNQDIDLQSLDLFERRKLLFGSDLLLTWKPVS